MMNIKKILVLLLFVITIVGITTPAEAKLDSSVETATLKPVNGKTEIYIHFWSNTGDYNNDSNYEKYFIKRKAELNKVNKVTFAIKGYKTITIKKPKKGWNREDISVAYDGTTYTVPHLVKGNPNGKIYSINFYDKKDKLIEPKIGYVHYEKC